jgi:hypothetical protein
LTLVCEEIAPDADPQDDRVSSTFHRDLLDAYGRHGLKLRLQALSDLLDRVVADRLSDDLSTIVDAEYDVAGDDVVQHSADGSQSTLQLGGTTLEFESLAFAVGDQRAQFVKVHGRDPSCLSYKVIGHSFVLSDGHAF